jgi:Ca-activated chloride channel homolog
MRTLLIILLILTVGLSVTLLAQGPQKGQFSIDVNLVALPVSVVDKDGNAIEGLTEKNFQVLEDNKPQEITLFRHEDVPVSLGMVIDSSGSMKNKKERVYGGALSFVKESNPDDETFVVAFDSSAWLVQDFTGSLGDLVDALDGLDPRLETAMFDAVYLSVDHIKKGKFQKKALLIISDGEDNASKWGFNKVLEHVQGAKDVVIYAVGVFEENDTRSGGLFGKSPQKKAREALRELAELTGGQAYFPKSIDEVADICRRIARELRNQYTVGYTSQNKNRDGNWRKVTVNLVNPPKNAGKPRVSTRQGYYAPDDSK